MKFLNLAAAASLLLGIASGQLSGPVGPKTSRASKAAKKICNVLDYGAKADKRTDLGPALFSAWTACKTGGVVYIPPGDYAMSSWQTLSGGSGWALQLDGIIYRTGTAGGHMIIIQSTNDFEWFSSTSKGAMQGYGYEFHAQGIYGPRLIRLVRVTNFSVHDILLVDSPAFHLIVESGTNGEVYNLVIRGGNRGGLDGIDTWGTNLWYHDIEVSNKDECVTIKSPSTYTLVENIYCNWSGGCGMGSFGAGTAISNIKYNNIYTWKSNQMFMLKSNGGSGYIRDCSFTNFIGHSNAYALNVNEYWYNRVAEPGNGVQLSGFTFSNWKGSISDAKRPAINVACSDAAPCTGFSLSNIAFWSDTNSPVKHYCQSAYGTGYCLKPGSGGAYQATNTISSAPAGWDAPKMPEDLKSGIGLTVSIAIPTIPTSFYPGATAISKLLGSGGGSGGGSTTAGGGGPTTTKANPTTTTRTTGAATTKSTTAVSGGGGCGSLYSQCGGIGWLGSKCCSSGTCKYSNDYYSQCL